MQVENILNEFGVEFLKIEDVISANIVLGNGDAVFLNFRDNFLLKVENQTELYGFSSEEDLEMDEASLRSLLTNLLQDKTYTYKFEVRMTFKTTQPAKLEKQLHEKIFELLNRLDDEFRTEDGVQFGLCRGNFGIEEAAYEPSAKPIDENQPEHDGRMTRLDTKRGMPFFFKNKKS